MNAEETPQFSTTLPLIVYIRPQDNPDADWQELDRGPGYFQLPAGQDVRVRIKSIGDDDLPGLVQELAGLAALRYLDLAENRNITNDGLPRLKALPQLTGLNLSSCSITSRGLEHLRALPRLETLNLSYCNRLTDDALKHLEAMRSLTFVDLQGCLGISKGGLARVRRRSLTIYR